MPDVKRYLICPFWAVYGPLPAFFIWILFNIYVIILITKCTINTLPFSFSILLKYTSPIEMNIYKK